jgi:hypothetical protein
MLKFSDTNRMQTMKYKHRTTSSYFNKFPLYLGLSLLAINSASNAHDAKSDTPVKAEISDVEIGHKPIGDKKMPGAVPPKLSRTVQIQNAVEDLAQRLSIDASAIKPLSASQVTWRSGAMGCPKPGHLYTQALVQGMLIVLGADGKHYRYHGSVSGKPNYCPSNRAETPATSRSDI